MSTMKKYKNIGTIAIMATLIIGGKDHDLILHPGNVCELPSDNLYVQRLVSQNHLLEVDEKPTTKLAPEVQPQGKEETKTTKSST